MHWLNGQVMNFNGQPASARRLNLGGFLDPHITLHSAQIPRCLMMFAKRDVSAAFSAVS